jgi:hypothetical protein
MYKKVLATSMVAASLFFAGCGEDSTGCRFEIQQDLDQARFDDAIDKLDGSCATTYTASDRYFNLATAYMGKAGFGAIDVVKIVLDANDTDGNAFSSFTRSVSDNINDDSLSFLKKSQNYFLLSVNPENNASKDVCSDTNTTDNNTTDSRVENACFYVGFNQTFQATTAITYLTNDVDTLVKALDDTNTTATTPLDMEVSLDALAWATDTNNTLPNGSVITPTDVTISGHPYTHLVIDINDSNNVPVTFYRLAKSSIRDVNNSTVITSGYCNADGNKTVCEGIEDNVTGAITSLNPVNGYTCYACPVMMDGNNSQSIADLLVDTLNGGTNTLTTVSDDEEIKDSLDQFVQDLTGDKNAKAGDTNVTLQQILDYLNK